MADMKVVVPDGMRKAAGLATMDVDPEGYIFHLSLQSAVRWLCGYLVDMVQHDQTMPSYRSESMAEIYQRNGYNLALADVRRMFTEPEPEPAVPDDLFFDFSKDKYPLNDRDFTKFVNTRIVDAYRRGQKAGK